MSDVPRHSIRIASQRSGIPIETLRVWERRYGGPTPQRQDGGNRRLYSDAEIERLRWVARGLAGGFRAGDVAAKSQAELEELIGPEPPRPPAEALPPWASVAHLVELAGRDDLRAIEDALRLGAVALGARRFVVEVVQPLATAVGEAWRADRIEVRQEHAVSEIIATQLRHMLATYQDVAGHPTVLLTTLPGEPHALGLAMVALYLTLSGAKPRLLGPSTPPDQIVRAARALHARVVGLTVTPASDPDATRGAVTQLARALPAGVSLWLGGSAAIDVAPSGDDSRDGRIRVVGSWEEIDAALAAVREGVPSS